MKRKFLLVLVFATFTFMSVAQTTIIPFGSTWKYLDNGSNQGTTWRNTDFNDATWANGPAQLGYGDGDEATLVNSGSPRYITTFFRRTVSLTTGFTSYSLRVKRDDGIVVYVNGIEVYRNNMPSGTISYTTAASTTSSDDGATILTSSILASPFVIGNNTIAVEIHQRSTSSSDISFDLELNGSSQNTGTVNEVIYQWSGAAQPTSATVVAKVTSASTTCRLVASTSSSLTSPLFSGFATASTANNFMAKMNITGLSPNTTYFYAIESNGVIDTSSDDIGKFTTPAANAFSYKFTVGSCAVSSNHQVYTLMNNKAPLFYMVTGDFHYNNPNSSTNINVHRQPYENNMLSQVPSRNFLKNTAFAFVWDDHDYCGNDSGGSSVGKANARQAYQEYVPHYPLAAGNGNVPIYQSFTIGRIHYILSDLRSERAGTSLMGTAQKTWFKNQCLYARDNNLMIGWVSGVSFGGNQSDNWGGFTAERTELSNFFRDNNIKNMFIMSGDAHMLAIDNGTNHDFSSGNNNPNDYPVFQAAAINNVGSTKGGTYSEGGTFPNSSLSTGQYGVIEVTDTGGSTITIKFTGYRTAGNTTSESILTSYTFTRTLSSALNRQLPSEISLRSVDDGQHIQVTWNNNDSEKKHKIVRSKNNKDFTFLRNIELTNGTYTDLSAENGWNYYRVLNANDEVLSEKSIYIKGQVNLKLYPNPANTIVNIQLNTLNEESTSRYIIYKENMKTAMQGELKLQKGDNNHQLDISSLETGTYFVHIVVNGLELVQKLIVIK